ncbi:B12 binding protein [Alkalibaculum bacchi]|uniref:B12 binding protein n=2 Tax=Alkalibaculum bacchi TaxID=645887 RepID=A0A366IC44_9FIRM|nr:B12-binding domain-containing protein [Alkalibaculum bacchi]RBP66654.1 B12 binding protein [Alkalibaculum bacchi]
MQACRIHIWLLKNVLATTPMRQGEGIFMNFKLITQLVSELEEDEVINLLNHFVQSNPSKEDAIKVIGACQKGMAIVGRHFENREYLVGDVIYAGELQQMILDLLEPIIGYSIVRLGTISGETKNIGERLFRKIIESSGYMVSTETC